MGRISETTSCCLEGSTDLSILVSGVPLWPDWRGDYSRWKTHDVRCVLIGTALSPVSATRPRISASWVQVHGDGDGTGRVLKIERARLFTLGTVGLRSPLMRPPRSGCTMKMIALFPLVERDLVGLDRRPTDSAKRSDLKTRGQIGGRDDDMMMLMMLMMMTMMMALGARRSQISASVAHGVLLACWSWRG